MSVNFLKQPDKSGWLTVRRADNNSRISLLRYLKVELIETRPDSRLDANKKRDFFKALEGSYKGVKFSVARKDDGSSFLGEGRHLVAGVVKFNRRTEQLWYGENGPVYAITDSDNKVPIGTFDLEIPDHPHIGGNNYIRQSSYAKVWFRIRPGGNNTQHDRYLHPGRGSLGCATVKDIDKWNKIYEYLIDRRKSDVSVGTITVFE